MPPISRRLFLYQSLAASAGWASAADAPSAKVNVHQQLLDLAAKQQKDRRARFASIKTKTELEALQKSLRQKFLDLLDGLPQASGPPPARKVDRINCEDYTIDKLVFESFPGYFVSALLYQPKKAAGPLPAILSPCGHSPVGKASPTYQILHVNLAKRGYMVLTYDPVGQAERSQFWDAAKQRSRYNLGCGEHAVLGNPLYLLGTSLARYRIWDGMRGIDYLTSLAEADGQRIGCIGNSGGGTLTAYIAALDPRVRVAISSCYITTLPRRMGNRIQRDPESDPEQDIFDFVATGIDHAGLLALRAPLPTQINAAQLDFFPIEGARETYAEVKKLYEAANAGDRFTIAEAAEKHGLTLPLREAAYAFFDRWLLERQEPRSKEIAVQPRPNKELLVCPDGQVNVTFKSRALLPLVWEQFQKRKPDPKVPLKDLLRLDPALADFDWTLAVPGTKGNSTRIVCINGIDSPDWREQKEFLDALDGKGIEVVVVDPRGVGKLRVPLEVKDRAYGDPLVGVEENIGYNSFLVGKSLLGMRVTDVLAALTKHKTKVTRTILCARRDAALVACLAAAVEPQIQGVAVEEMVTGYRPYFSADAAPINVASILPRMLRDFGDWPDVLTAIAPRRLLLAAPGGKNEIRQPGAEGTEKGFVQDPKRFLQWLEK